jgi:hypothetical protein
MAALATRHHLAQDNIQYLYAYQGSNHVMALQCCVIALMCVTLSSHRALIYLYTYTIYNRVPQDGAAAAESWFVVVKIHVQL